MTWGTHCSICGHETCEWVYGNMCDGKQRRKKGLPPPPKFKWWQLRAKARNKQEASDRRVEYIRSRNSKTYHINGRNI